MKRIFTTAAGLSLAVFAAPAHAQTSDYETALRGQSMEARVGLTIPFGGDRRSKTSKPQLALITRRTQASSASVDWAMKPGLKRTEYVETRLALTLSTRPQLRLNGQEIYDFGGEHVPVSDEVKTAGKIALGAGLVVVAAAIVVVGIYAISYEPDDS